MSNTFHLSLDVPDLDRSVAFYTELFGQEPSKRKPGYAKFEIPTRQLRSHSNRQPARRFRTSESGLTRPLRSKARARGSSKADW